MYATGGGLLHIGQITDPHVMTVDISGQIFSWYVLSTTYVAGWKPYDPHDPALFPWFDLYYADPTQDLITAG